MARRGPAGPACAAQPTDRKGRPLLGRPFFVCGIRWREGNKSRHRRVPSAKALVAMREHGRWRTAEGVLPCQTCIQRPFQCRAPIRSAHAAFPGVRGTVRAMPYIAARSARIRACGAVDMPTVRATRSSRSRLPDPSRDQVRADARAAPPAGSHRRRLFLRARAPSARPRLEPGCKWNGGGASPCACISLVRSRQKKQVPQIGGRGGLSAEPGEGNACIADLVELR